MKSGGYALMVARSLHLGLLSVNGQTAPGSSFDVLCALKVTTHTIYFVWN